jgi:hypothetical protein
MAFLSMSNGPVVTSSCRHSMEVLSLQFKVITVPLMIISQNVLD